MESNLKIFFIKVAVFQALWNIVWGLNANTTSINFYNSLGKLKRNNFGLPLLGGFQNIKHMLEIVAYSVFQGSRIL